MLRFECVHCGNEIVVHEKHAGQMGTCRKCQGPIRAPRPADNVWVPDGLPIQQTPAPLARSPVWSGFGSAFGGFFGFIFALILFFVLLVAYGQYKAKERREQIEEAIRKIDSEMEQQAN